MSKVLTVNGEEVGRLGIRDTKNVCVTDDDDSANFFKNLPGVEMQLHIGDKAYTVTMSLDEYRRMVDDGVME